MRNVSSIFLLLALSYGASCLAQHNKLENISQIVGKPNSFNKHESRWFLGFGAHSYGYIPWPLVDVGYEGKYNGFRFRLSAPGIGRIGAEISVRNLFNYKVHPYLSFGRNYYVLGFNTYYGAGLEFQFKDRKKYFQIELSKVGLTPAESVPDHRPRYEITYGFGKRF